nr:serine hydrolase domain-containing protein [Allomuricauda sp.]
MKKVSTFLLLFSVISIFAQLSEIEEQQIDSIFSEWKGKDKPGVATGLIYGNEIQYTKAFGIADVENGRPITIQTKFQIDYLSRQFAILAVLILQEQGKIQWDDAVLKYITELPKYDYNLTISHLLNHTSGLNDYEIIKGILGIREDAVFTHDDALKLIQGQKNLNFIPGTQFSYMTSKTELTLLAEVVKKASGKTLAEFAQEFIFAPLGMSNTVFLDDYNTIISDIGISYQTIEDRLSYRNTNLGNAGPTNLYTSAEDLKKWYATLTGISQNTLSPLIQKLDNPVQLNDGTVFESWWGRLTLGRAFYHLERGLPAFWQFGLVGGYGANVFRFPEQKLTSFVIGNNNNYNGMPAMLQANHFIESEYTEPSSVEIHESDLRKLSIEQLKKYEGHYWDAKRGLARKLHVMEDTLFYARPEVERGALLIPLKTKERFQLKIDGDEKIFFTFKNIKEKFGYEITLGNSQPYTYLQYQPVEYSPEQLQEFTGNFYEENLKVLYQFKVVDGQLIAYGPVGIEVIFHPVTKDVFRSPTPSFGSIRFQRTQENGVRGFSIYTDGIQNLKFKKLYD